MIVPIIFSRVLTMSLTGGIVIVLVLVIRLFLTRLPKIFSYLLWGVVLLRLLCPVSFSSGLSVFQVIAHAGIIQTESNEAQALPLRFPTGMRLQMRIRMQITHQFFIWSEKQEPMRTQ